MKALCEYNQGFNRRYLRGLSIKTSRERARFVLRNLALPVDGVYRADVSMFSFRRLFAFVAIAERQLTVDELFDALTVYASAKPDEEPTVVENHRSKQQIIQELCAPLLELDRTANYANPSVRFIHRTAREFLCQEPEMISELTEFPECQIFFPGNQKQHLEFGRFCLFYLSRRDHAYATTSTLEKTLCNDGAYEKCAFLKYASIFWHHHLNKISEEDIKDDLFKDISTFMRSSNFLTCIWVQSQYAPYQLARYTQERKGGTYRINTPKDVYSQAPGSTHSFADPLPEWLAKYNPAGSRLTQGYQLFIKEFGLVLLRRRGGIRHCNPGSLGQLNFLCEKHKSLALEKPRDAIAEAVSVNRREKHLLSLVASPTEIIATSFTVDSESKPSATLRVKEWQVRLHLSQSRPKSKLMRELPLSFPFPPSDVPFLPKGAHLPSDVFVIPSPDGAILSLGLDTVDLFHASLKLNCVRALGCGGPAQILQEHCLADDKGMEFRGRHYACHDNTSVVSYRWFKSSKGLRELQKSAASNLPDVDPSSDASDTDSDKNSESESSSGSNSAYAFASAFASGFASAFASDSDSDSESDSDADPDSVIDPDSVYDSGYSTASRNSSITGPTEKGAGCTSLVILSNDRDPRWLHFATTGTPLRQSPPTFHPKKPFVLLPLDGSRTIVIDQSSAKTMELCSPTDPERNDPVAKGTDILRVLWDPMHVYSD
jgi:hypothetical protein